MRSLAISLIAILLVIGAWWGFMDYTENTLSQLTIQLDETIVPAIHSGQWEAASEEFYHFSRQWHDRKSIMDFFLDTATMADTDFSIARAEAYIASRDKTPALGELSGIREQMRFLYTKEKISIENLL